LNEIFRLKNILLWALHKRHPQLERGALTIADIFGQGGDIFQMQMAKLLVAKTYILEMLVCPH